MSHYVPAPEGFEGYVYYCDATKSWKVSFKAKGDTWWTNCGFAGPSHVTALERDARAKAVIVDYLKIHGLI